MVIAQLYELILVSIAGRPVAGLLEAGYKGYRLARKDRAAAFEALSRCNGDHWEGEWPKLAGNYPLLLELEPVIDADARTFELSHDRRQRKAAGSYYTPEHLIDWLLDTALEPMLQKATRSPDAESAILRLRLCDPACGAGRFLVAAARRIARRLATARGDGNYARALIDVLRQCIYGVDLDPLAVRLCRFTLFLEARRHERSLRCLKAHIRHGDSLLDDNEREDFDVIVGNPPYGVPLSKAERRRLNAWAIRSRAAGNSAAYFIEHCARLVRPGGRVGLVVPKSLTYSHDWRRLRNWLKPRLLAARDASQAWDDVLLEQVLITFQGISLTDQTPQIRGGAGVVACRGRRGRLPHSHRLEIIPTGLNDRDQRLLEIVLKAAPHSLGELCVTRRGSSLQRYLGEDGLPVLGGKDIAEFQPPEENRFLSKDIPVSATCRARPPQAVFQNIVAHLRRPADHIRLIGTVVTEPLACLDTVNLLTPTDRRLSPYALSGLLMSNLINWFVYVCVYNRAVRTMHFDGYFLSQIPVPEVHELATLHALALKLAEEPKSMKRWSALNRWVFDLYAVPKGLARYVNMMHKPRHEQRTTNH